MDERDDAIVLVREWAVAAPFDRPQEVADIIRDHVLVELGLIS